MISPLARLLHRPVAVSMFCGAVVLAGLFAFTRLPLELAPSIDFPSLTITTSWPNASPETMEQFVTAPIEEVVNTVAGVKNVRSRSSEGRSTVDVEFEQGTAMNFARLELYEKLAALAERFPPGVQPPTIERYVPEDFRELQGFMTFALSSERPAAVLRAFARERLVPALLSVRGVARAEVVGGEDRELQVVLDPDRVVANGLTVEGIVAEMGELEGEVSAGTLRRGAGRAVLSLRNARSSLDDVLHLPVGVRASGTLVRLGDVAAVYDTVSEVRNIYRINGQPAVTLVVDKEPHVNIIEGADRVSARLSEAVAQFSTPLQVTTVIDRSLRMREELSNLKREIGFSLLFIMAVLAGAFGNVRAPVMMMTALILSLAGTLVVFWLLGLSLHLLTLAGLVLGFGRVVDDAIVVLDNIQRRSQHEVTDASIIHGVQQVRLAVIASTITTVGALVPLAFLPENLKPYFMEFALAVGISLLMSLIVSLTVIPVFVRLYPGALRSHSRLAEMGELVLAGYRALLRLALKRRKTVLGLVVLAFGLPVWLLPEHIASESLPARAYNAVFSSEAVVSIRPYLNHVLGGASHLFFTKVTKGEVWEWGNETYLVVRVGFPQGTELHRYDEVARSIEQEVLASPEGVRVMTTRIGPDYASVRVDFDEKAARTVEPFRMKNRLTVLAAQTGGATISVAGFGPGFYSGGESAPSFYVKVLGYNYRRVREIAERFKDKLERNPRIAEVDIDRSFGRFTRSTELVATLDRDALATHHLTVAEVLPWIGSLTRGTLERHTVRLRDDRVPLAVKMAGYDSLSVSGMGEAGLVNARRELVKFGELLDVRERRVMPEILRENQEYVRWISFEYRGPYRYGDQFVDATIRSMPLPHGYRFDRQFGWLVLRAEEEASLLWIALAAALIVFMVTASLYESFRKPVLVLVSLPLSLIGLFMIFYLTDTPFGRGGYAALMLLIGIVVANAIVLVDYVAGYAARAVLSDDEFVHRCSERVRPIVMTSATTVAALLPLLLWSGPSSIWYSLALGVIGGLVASTVLVLVVLPLLLSVLVRHSFGTREG